MMKEQCKIILNHHNQYAASIYWADVRKIGDQRALGCLTVPKPLQGTDGYLNR